MLSMFKKFLVLFFALVLLSNTALAKAVKDFYVIDGKKYVADSVLKNTTNLGIDRALIILTRSADKDVATNITIDLGAAESFQDFYKGLKIDIQSSTANLDDSGSEEDLGFKDEALVFFYHAKANAVDDTATTYTNDSESELVGSLVLNSFNKKTGKAVFSFNFDVTNPLMAVVDSDLNTVSEERSSTIKVSGQFTTDLI